MFVLSVLVTFQQSGVTDVAHTTFALDNPPLYQKKGIEEKVRQFVQEVVRSAPEGYPRDIVSVSHSLIY